MKNTARFSRRPFEVEAVQVTLTNISEVSDWCRGITVASSKGRDENGHTYIQVPVMRARHSRQTRAFVGDWVLRAGGGFKVYTAKAFAENFEPSTTLV